METGAATTETAETWAAAWAANFARGADVLDHYVDEVGESIRYVWGPGVANNAIDSTEAVAGAAVSSTENVANNAVDSTETVAVTTVRSVSWASPLLIGAGLVLLDAVLGFPLTRAVVAGAVRAVRP